MNGIPAGIPNDTPMAQAVNAQLGHADLMEIYWAAVDSGFYSAAALWHLLETLKDQHRGREVARNEEAGYARRG